MMDNNNNCASNFYLIDYHLHTCCSKDGAGKVKEHCKEAVKKGFTEICITNHQEWISAASGYYDYAMRNEGWRQLIADIDAARKEYPMLSVKLGCEIGYYPQYVNDIIRFTKQHPFDYIISSIHVLDGKPPADPTISGGKDKNVLIEWQRRYLSAVKEMVDHAYFDCIGHLDGVKRNIPYVTLEEFQDLLWDIAGSMKKNNIGFELNTSGLRHSTQECYPSVNILKILKEAGVEKVTIGSDSHSPETLGKGIRKGMEILKQVGFVSVCTFSKRIPIYHPLDMAKQ